MSEASERYEPSLLVEYLGDTPYVRVLDYFIMNKRWDASIQDVMDHTLVSRNTVRKIIKKMEKLNLIQFTRNLGRAKLYQLSRNNPCIDYLIELDMNISREYAKNVPIAVPATVK